LKLAMLLYIEKEGEDPKRSKKAKKWAALEICLA
jgi:hypothetical protein